MFGKEGRMKHTMTLYIAERKINDFMKAFDMRPDSKWFVHPEVVSFETTTAITPAYFEKLIKESKSNELFWIPGITYMENHFIDPSVKILSDGQKEFFVGVLNDKTRKGQGEIQNGDGHDIRGIGAATSG
jgi:hypothetical protein